MATRIGDAIFVVSADTRQAEDAVRRAAAGMEGSMGAAGAGASKGWVSRFTRSFSPGAIHKQVDQVGGRINKTLLGAAAIGAGAFTALLGGSLVGGLNRALDTEDATAQMMRFGLSTDEVDTHLDTVRETFKHTPFSYPDLFNMSAQLQATGMGLGDVEGVMMTVGDMATHAGVPLDQMSGYFVDIANRGNVTRTTLNSMAQAGIPLGELASALGMTTEEMLDAASAGEISADEFFEAAKSVDMWSGASETAADTTRGAFGVLMSAIAGVGEAFLSPLFGINGFAVTSLKAISESFFDLAGPAERAGEIFAAWLMPRIEWAIGAFQNLGTTIQTRIIPVVRQVINWYKEHSETIHAVAKAVAPVIAGFLAFASAVNVLTRVMRVLMVATPVGMLLAIASALVYAWQNSEQFRTIVTRAFEAVKTAFSTAIEAVRPIIDVLKNVWDSFRSGTSSLSPLSGAVGSVVSSFSNFASSVWGYMTTIGGIVADVIQGVIGWFVNADGTTTETGEKFMGVWQTVLSTVSTVFNGLADLISWITGFIKSVWDTHGEALLETARRVFSGILSVIEGAFQIIGGIFDLVLGILTGDWSRAWDGIKAIFEGVWNIIKGILEAALAIVVQVISSTLQTIANIFTAGWDIVKSIFQSFATFFYGLWQGLWSFAIDILTTVMGAIGSFLSTVWEGIKNVIIAFYTWVWEYFTDRLNSIREMWQTVWSAISSFFTNIWNNIQTFFTTMITNFIASFTARIFSIRETWNNIWSSISEFFTNIWNNITTFFSTIISNFIMSFTERVNSIRMIWSNTWNAVSSFFSNIWNNIVTFFSNIWNMFYTRFMNGLNKIYNFWANVWNNISSFFSNIWNNIVSFFSGVLTNFTTMFSNRISNVRTIWSNIWNWVSSFFSNIWNNITSFFSNIVNNLISRVRNFTSSFRNIFQAGVQVLRTIWSNVWNAIVTFFNNIWNRLTRAVSNMMGSVRNFVTSGMNAVRNAWTNAWNAVTNVLSRIRTNITNAVSNMISAVRNAITNGMNAVRNAWTNSWNTIRNFVTNIGSSIRSAITSVMSGVRNAFQSGVNSIVSVWYSLSSTLHGWLVGASGPLYRIRVAVNNFFSAVRNAFNTGVAAIGRLWGALQNVTRAPVNFVINTVYNRGVKRLWDAIAGRVGFKKLPTVKGLNTGGFVPGSGPNRDTELIAATPQEFMINRKSASIAGRTFLEALNSVNSPADLGNLIQHMNTGGQIQALNDGGDINPLGWINHFKELWSNIRGARGGSTSWEKMARSAGFDLGRRGMGNLIGRMPGGSVIRKALGLDAGGLLPQGMSLVANDTGRPEPLTRTDTLVPLLKEIRDNSYSNVNVTVNVDQISTDIELERVARRVSEQTVSRLGQISRGR